MKNLLRLSAVLFSILLALPASAVQRTFVASFGNDANFCSITAPCRGIARALTQTDANGEVIVLDSAGYGTFTINQSVSVIAPDGIYAGISVFPGQNGIVVNGGASVVLRGLNINGQGGNEGIYILGGTQVHIERCVISNMGDAGIRVEGGTSILVSDSVIRSNAGRGIDILGGTPRVFVNDTRVTRNGSHGIFIAAGGLTLNRVTADEQLGGRGLEVNPNVSTTVQVAVRDSEFSGNGSAGIFLFPENTGAQAFATVERSSALRNGSTGFVVNTFSVGTGVMRITDSVSSNPGIFGVGSFGTNATVILTGNTVTGNLTGLSASFSGVIDSCGDNKVFGNTTNGTATPIACAQ